jgi:hypothetical protein
MPGHPAPFQCCLYAQLSALHLHTLLLHSCTAGPAPTPQLLRIHSSCAACQSLSARAPPELLLLRPRATAARRVHPAMPSARAPPTCAPSRLAPPEPRASPPPATPASPTRVLPPSVPRARALRPSVRSWARQPARSSHRATPGPASARARPAPSPAQRPPALAPAAPAPALAPAAARAPALCDTQVNSMVTP